MIAPGPFRFTVERYDAMIDAGILGENDAVELIRGEIVPKMPIGSRHLSCVMRLTRQLTLLCGDMALVSPQNPVRFADSEPEPDVAVLRPRPDDYADAKPEPPDVLSIIEVADASLEFDREDKLPIYAEAAIREYWIVNLPDEVIEVYRDPAGKSYRSRRVARHGDSLTLLALPNVTIAVSDILP